MCAACARRGADAERASLGAGTEQAKAERDNLAARYIELEASAVTYSGELGVMRRDRWSLVGCVAAGEIERILPQLSLVRR